MVRPLVTNEMIESYKGIPPNEIKMIDALNDFVLSCKLLSDDLLSIAGVVRTESREVYIRVCFCAYCNLLSIKMLMPLSYHQNTDGLFHTYQIDASKMNSVCEKFDNCMQLMYNHFDVMTNMHMDYEKSKVQRAINLYIYCLGVCVNLNSKLKMIYNEYCRKYNACKNINDMNELRSIIASVENVLKEEKAAWLDACLDNLHQTLDKMTTRLKLMLDGVGNKLFEMV